MCLAEFAGCLCWWDRMFKGASRFKCYSPEEARKQIGTQVGDKGAASSPVPSHVSAKDLNSGIVGRTLLACLLLCSTTTCIILNTASRLDHQITGGVTRTSTYS